MPIEIARSFSELRVYRAGREAAKAIFDRSKLFPHEEKHSLTDQIRRSSRAVNAMVAEAWARRRYKAAFVNRIDEALGEAQETQAWLDHALDCGYLKQSKFDRLDSQWQAIGRMLSRMIDRASDFCKFAPDTDYRRISSQSGIRRG